MVADCEDVIVQHGGHLNGVGKLFVWYYMVCMVCMLAVS